MAAQHGMGNADEQTACKRLDKGGKVKKRGTEGAKTDKGLTGKSGKANRDEVEREKCTSKEWCKET